MAKILQKVYGKYYPITAKEAYYFIIKIGALLGDANADIILHKWHLSKRLSNVLSIKVLGMKYRPAEESLLSMTDTIINEGIL